MENNSPKRAENGESTDSAYVTRLIRTEEIAESFKLVEQEDWNLTLVKFQELHKVFPSSVFVTIKKQTQEVVAVASAIPTFPGQYVIGNLVVRTDHQSRGLGKFTLRQLLNNLQDMGPFTATLTAVPGVDQFYSKMGFDEVDFPHDVNYVTVDRPGVQKAVAEHITDHVTVSEYTPDKFQALNDYDTQARGYDCGRYLSVMIHAADTFLLATHKVSGQVIGYSAGVNEPELLLVDGLYADDDGTALCLYSKLLDMYPNQHEIKVQEIKPKDFLSRFGELLPKSHNYKRMANGPVAPVQLSKLYVVIDCDYSE